MSIPGVDSSFAAQFPDDYFAECDENLMVIRPDVLALETPENQWTCLQ